MKDTRVVIGVPLYSGVSTGHLEGAVRSLLDQTYTRIAYVFVDDGESGAALDAVAALAAGDARVHLERNPRRLGLVANWRQVFARARTLYPEATYFAWGSDHDKWHPKWAAHLVKELDAHPDAVMAYPRFVRIDDRDRVISRAWPSKPRTEFVSPLAEKVGAGNLVYGLFRSDAVAKAGGYPMIYRPDIYLLMELSLYGQLRLVEQTLWFRRERPHNVAKDGTRLTRRRGDSDRATYSSNVATRMARLVGIGPISRQHRSTFPAGVPLYARLPAPVQHAARLFWRLSIRGRGRPTASRWTGAVCAARVLGLVAPSSSVLDECDID